MTRRTEPTEMRGQPFDMQPGMVCAGNRNGWTSTAERLPVVYRAGSMDAYKLPSRAGSRLVYPDGRVVVVKERAARGFRRVNRQLVPYHDEVHLIDLKRAAAGDRDD